MSARFGALLVTVAIGGLLILIALAGFLFSMGFLRGTPQPTVIHATINGAVSVASMLAILAGLVRWLRNRADSSLLIWAVVLALAAHCGILLAAIVQQG